MSIEFGKPYPLPCEPNCPFSRLCQVKYYEINSCAEAIDMAVDEVSETHSELSITGDLHKLRFTTVRPFTLGYIENGQRTVWNRE